MCQGTSWGTTVTPVDQPQLLGSAAVYFLASTSARVRLRRSHNLGIGSETLGSCCSSQTRARRTCHHRFPLQLPATTTRALTQGQNNRCHQVGEHRRRQREVEVAARRCMLDPAALKPTSYQALHCRVSIQPLALARPDLLTTWSSRLHTSSSSSSRLGRASAPAPSWPRPLLSRESCLPRCFPPSDGSRDLRGKQLESLGQAVTHTGRRKTCTRVILFKLNSVFREIFSCFWRVKTCHLV